ncbi:MAG: SH3 domain-containing protein [Bacteroidetes bacterium]|nr:SH3 domain-containing protein [Bacteroidota bacterium]
MTRNCLLLILTLYSFSLLAQVEEVKIMDRAKQAYENEAFTTAMDLYEVLLEEGWESADLHYNYGLTAFHKGETGKAILHFEKAHRLAPRDAAIKHNLEQALESTRNEIYPLPPFFLKRWWQGFFQLASREAWTTLSLIFLYLGIAGLAIWMLGRMPVWRKRAFWTGVSALMLALIFYAFANGRASWQANDSQAVFMADQHSLKSGPSEDSEGIKEVYEGLLVEILDFDGAWYKVRLRNGEEGWLPASDLERI